MAAPPLPPPPLDTPVLDSNGLVTMVWARWFRQVWDYVR